MKKNAKNAGESVITAVSFNCGRIGHFRHESQVRRQIKKWKHLGMNEETAQGIQKNFQQS